MTNSDNKMLSAPVLYTFDFERSVLFQLQNTPYGQNWPVVYILSNGSEAYVGETSNASQRIINHLDNKKRKNLKRLDLLYSQSFNKSAILDLEASLILCMTSDQKFDLQNRNSGQSQAHDYYQRQEYQNLFPKIWNLLRKNHLADSSLDQIYNSDLFKFSPYKTLTVDQFEIAQSIICSLLERIQDQADLNPDEQFAIQKDPIFVHGGAGTGKSVLGVYLAKTIADLKDGIIPDMEKLPDMAPEIQVLKDSDFKIGLVVPVNAFKKTLSKVFKSLKIRNIQVVSPVDAAKKKWDLLIVDERITLNRIQSHGYQLAHG